MLLNFLTILDLTAVQTGQEGTFDMGFIDADKPGYDDYYEKLLKLLRPGGVIVVDNTLWDGMVIKPECQDDNTLVRNRAHSN